MIPCNSNVLTDNRSAEKLLITAANDTVLIVLLDFVERNQREGRIYLYSFLVLADQIATDVGFGSQSNLNPNFILPDTVADDLQLELFPHQVHSYRIILYQILNNPGAVFANAPD